MATRYVVRDVRTRGVDYLLWGDDDEVGARASLAEAQAMFGDDAVELVTMSAHAMDDHTRMLIEGDDPPWVRKLKALAAQHPGEVDLVGDTDLVNDRRHPDPRAPDVDER